MKHCTAKEKELADNARLLRAWRAFHREERDTVLAGPHARTLAELFRMFSSIQYVTPAQLVGFIDAIDWSAIDYQTRLTVLHEVNTAITKFRERQGLDSISDPLPGAPPNAFQIIRAIITTNSRNNAGERQDPATAMQNRVNSEKCYE
jgi:hypothetical protein